MKSVFNFFKGSSNSSSEQPNEAAVIQNLEVEEKNAQKATDASESLQKAFDSISAKIQETLDEGAAALKIAEEKTAEVAKADINLPNYQQMVEEVKSFQAKAGEAFKRAEEMIAATNELLTKENLAN